MVVMKDGVKESSLNRRRQHDLPTPESPISKSLICEAKDLISTWSVQKRWRRKVEGVKGMGEGASYQEIVIAISRHDERWGCERSRSTTGVCILQYRGSR